MTDKQPAAWMYERDSLLPVHLCKDRLPEVSRKVYQTETPLYARPATAQGDVEVLETAVMVCPQCEGEGGYPDGLDEDACHEDCTRCEGDGWIVNVPVVLAAMTERDRALRKAAFEAGYDAALDNMEPGGPILMTGNANDGWKAYLASTGDAA